MLLSGSQGGFTLQFLELYIDLGDALYVRLAFINKRFATWFGNIILRHQIILLRRVLARKAGELELASLDDEYIETAIQRYNARRTTEFTGRPPLA